MDLCRRYVLWNDTPDIERYEKCDWWESVSHRTTSMLFIDGITYQFDDDLRRTTMLEF